MQDLGHGESQRWLGAVHDKQPPRLAGALHRQRFGQGKHAHAARVAGGTDLADLIGRDREHLSATAHQQDLARDADPHHALRLQLPAQAADGVSQPREVEIELLHDAARFFQLRRRARGERRRGQLAQRTRQFRVPLLEREAVVEECRQGGVQIASAAVARVHAPTSASWGVRSVVAAGFCRSTVCASLIRSKCAGTSAGTEPPRNRYPPGSRAS